MYAKNEQNEAEPSVAPTPRLLSEKDVVSRVGLSRSTVRKLVLSGDFPRPQQIGKNRMLYLEQHVSDWILSHFEKEAS
jgi:predicted DNA-binding transcriptional regulator AlpA